MFPTSGISMKKKTTKGRKKIEIKKIEETNSRQVTFSKRRTGLFKKASELCVLTGAEIAILVNSPGGRVFAFGHPNADVLIDRYLKTDKKDNKITTNHHSPPPLPMQEFNQHYVEVSRELEVEKKRREMIPSSSGGGVGGGLRWFEEATDGLEVEELEQYLWSLVELKKKVLTRADELMMINKSPVMLGGPTNVFLNGWSGFSGEQMVGGPMNVHGGFVFQHGGDMGKF